MPAGAHVLYYGVRRFVQERTKLRNHHLAKTARRSTWKTKDLFFSSSINGGNMLAGVSVGRHLALAPAVPSAEQKGVLCLRRRALRARSPCLAPTAGSLPGGIHVARGTGMMEPRRDIAREEGIHRHSTHARLKKRECVTRRTTASSVPHSFQIRSRPYPLEQ